MWNDNIENINGVWNLFADGKTKGIFQLESNLGKNWSKKLKPENLEQLAALVTILRPGCIHKDTKIIYNFCLHKDGNYRYKKKTIEHIFKNKNHYKKILCVDENNNIILNDVEDIISSGKKECYEVITREKAKSFDKLICTLDHKILTSKGWKCLKDLKNGDRILRIFKSNIGKPIGIRKEKFVRNGVEYKNIHGSKSFRSICYNNYEEKCLLCDWDKATLDVNHINGNRFSNNDVENLCFLCPNHHREFTENKIDKEILNKKRVEHLLPIKSDKLIWCTFEKIEYIGKEDTYDICMKSPNNNFIAGSTIVHNSLKAIIEDKSITQHYIDRRHKREPITYIDDSCKDILEPTLGLMLYQEQTMQIAKKIAGFTDIEADKLRKAIGKKKVDLMEKLKSKFVDGCEKTGIVSREKGLEIFEIIEKSARYQFNACLDPNTYVETDRGEIKTLDELSIGEKILCPTEDGDKFVEVLNFFESGEKELYEVELEEGYSIICSLDHRFLCEDEIKRPLSEIILYNHKIMCIE